MLKDKTTDPIRLVDPEAPNAAMETTSMPSGTVSLPAPLSALEGSSLGNSFLVFAKKGHVCLFRGARECLIQRSRLLHFVRDGKGTVKCPCGFYLIARRLREDAIHPERDTFCFAAKANEAALHKCRHGALRARTTALPVRPPFDGQRAIRLCVGVMDWRAPRLGESRHQEPPRREYAKQPRLSPLATLQKIQRDAETNVVDHAFYALPKGKRFWARRLFARLKSKTDELTVTKSCTFGEITCVPERNLVPIDRCFENVTNVNSKTLVLIGFMRPPSRHSPMTLNDGVYEIGLDGFCGTVRVPRERWKRAKRSFGRIVSNGLLRTLAILFVQRDQSGQLFVRKLAWQNVTPEGVPSQSSYEARMIRYCVRKQRTFEKPLPKQEIKVGDHYLLPDLILTDTAPRRPIEVWGRRDPEYLGDRRAKTERYKAAGIVFTGWDARRGDPLPKLPPTVDSTGFGS
jgi:hypothetical protein